METLSIGTKVKKFYDIVKPILIDGKWITSEKLCYRIPDRVIEQNKFTCSTLLKTLYEKGYLDRTSAKRIYFGGKQRKTYNGKYAYRLKEGIINPSINQLSIL
jgi:predicted transcriptional regulator